MTYATTNAQQLAQDLTQPSPPHRALTTAATLGVLGGLALFADLSLHAFGPLDRSYVLLAIGMTLCLLGGPTAYWLRGAITTGWRRALGIVGTGIVVVGAAAWITAFTILFTDPEAAFTQRLTPAGSLLMALGMTLLGLRPSPHGDSGESAALLRWR